MPDTLIRKANGAGHALPNLPDYDAARAGFSWAMERQALRGLSGGGLNIAVAALDRHVRNGRGRQVALRCLSRGGAAREFTYAELAAETNRFANVLRALGVRPGERAPLRDQIDIDSMDFLNFVTAVHKQLGVPIPELDYPRLSSLNGAVHYLTPKLAG